MKQVRPALVVIDAQKGFLDLTYWSQRNNPDMECRLRNLLETYRRFQLPILHVQHLSMDSNSPLRRGQQGVDFIDGIEPQMGERVFQKSVNSAFIGTNLAEYLRGKNLTSLVLAGFTTDHCVSTSARMAANLGFCVTVLSDCTATFARPDGVTTFPADLVHQVSLASLRGEFASITTAASNIESLVLEN